MQNLIHKFFYPKNIVVVGVSPAPHNLAKNIVMNCLISGYSGEILSVGAKGGVIFGQQIYRSLEEIDRPVELAVILTPAHTIPGILEQCGFKGIKWVVIESAGFSELGKEGQRLERACLQAAKKHGIRFIGPNGIGVINMETGLAMPFVPLQRDIPLGTVSILAQSGGVGLSYLAFLSEERVGVNKFVSMGNKLNVDENDLLSYLIQDTGTKVILVYLEGFTDGRRFVEIASRSPKPILVHKSNRFKVSERIAHSHTAALAADDKLVDFALEQAGCVRADTMAEAIGYAKALTLPPLNGNRLAVVSRSGGHAVIAADACAHYGFRLPSFPGDFLKEIENRLRAHVISLQNPLDLGDIFDLDFYEYIVDELLRREDVDGVLLGHGYHHRGPERDPSRRLVQKVSSLVEKYKKPVALFVFTESGEMDYLRRSSRIPIFSSPESAMRAFDLSYRWVSRRPVRTKRTPLAGVDAKKAGELIGEAGGNPFLLLSDALDLIRCYGFDTPGCRTAETVQDALRAMHALGPPVAMKINRPYLSHKSDLGAVKLELTTDQEIGRAFEELQEAAGGGPIEVLVQEMIPRGREVILGGKQDDVFGPVVLFGIGGIFVEALDDVVWRLAPIDRMEARRMIDRIKGRRILSGIRGEPPADIPAIEKMLVSVSRMLADHPRIREIDINPVMVFTEGAKAVDARVILRDAAPGTSG